MKISDILERILPEPDEPGCQICGKEKVIYQNDDGELVICPTHTPIIIAACVLSLVVMYNAFG